LRILVLSDSHRNSFALKRAIDSQRSAEIVIFLGDGINDFEALKSHYPEKMFLAVKGNCDFGAKGEEKGIFTVEGVKIFYTHGHIYNVKYGLYNAVMAAREAKAKILLYGHTHIPLTDYEDGLYIMNPGSVGSPRDGRATYGIIDIVSSGIMTNIVNVNF